MKKDYDVVREAQTVIEDYLRRKKKDDKSTPVFPMYIGAKKPQNISVCPIIALAVIFSVLCIANIILWFLY